MFSIIIPLYNKSEYILKAVNSVLNQKFSDFELIIINDGSTDDSLIKLESISDSRVKVISQPNSGVSTARNNGIKESANDYIAFLDADDWWHPHYLDEMRRLIQSYPDAGLFGAKYYEVKYGVSKEAIIGVDKDFHNGYIDYFDVYAKTMWMPFFPSSVILKRNVFNDTDGFKVNLKLGEDFDLWIRIALKYKVAYLNKALVYYNQDVDIINRAVSPSKLYYKEDHYIFQLDYLSDMEKRNQSLKLLLDKKRIGNLFRYYISKSHERETNLLLSKVDFREQPFSIQLKFRLPIQIVRAYYYIRKRGYIIKKFLKKIYIV